MKPRCRSLILALSHPCEPVRDTSTRPLTDNSVSIIRFLKLIHSNIESVGDSRNNGKGFSKGKESESTNIE